MVAYESLSDIEITDLFKSGDQAAFTVLYKRFHSQVYRYALRIVKYPEAAEEIMQNVMLKVWQQRGQIDTAQNFKGWIARVTANQAFDFLKTLARQHALSEKIWLQMQKSPAYSENEYVLKEYLFLVEEAVNTLPPQQQKIYRMSREEYLTYEEIAQILNISPNTVRNHMASALTHIRKYISGRTAAIIPFIIFFLN